MLLSTRTGPRPQSLNSRSSFLSSNFPQKSHTFPQYLSHYQIDSRVDPARPASVTLLLGTTDLPSPFPLLFL